VTRAHDAGSRAVVVDVWRFALDTAPTELERLRRTLSADELRRAATFRFACGAERFVAGRGLLRRVLGRLAGQDPAALEIAYGAFGKPHLAGEPSLRFNLAHSDDVALLAVADGADVGIDVEAVAPGRDCLAIARDFFCARELRELVALPTADRAAAFLRCWTRKEAYVKALGDGLQAPLDDFAVSLRPAEPARIVWSRRDAEVLRWTLDDISQVAGDATAAVCVMGGQVRVRTHDGVEPA
jgi:4'-phosphopantetheinyl transferase